MFESKTVKASGNPAARGIKRVALSLLVAVASTLAVSAWAQGHGHESLGGGGFGGPGMFMGHPERMARGIDHMLDGLNATDAQRGQIQQIVAAAAADLKAQHEASKGLREQGLQLFTAPVVDARAVESARVQAMAQHDQASKRVTQALLEISSVLTPEQRVKLGERIKQRAQHRRERMERHGAGSAPTK